MNMNRQLVLEFIIISRKTLTTCKNVIGLSLSPCLSMPFLTVPSSWAKGVSQFFTSGGQSIEVSASASVFTMTIQHWFPLGWTGWLSLQITGKDPSARKDWRQEKGMSEDEMVGWHHWLNGHEFEQALGVGDGQGSLACCSPWGRKESDTTELLNWPKGIGADKSTFSPVEQSNWSVYKGFQSSQILMLLFSLFILHICDLAWL